MALTGLVTRKEIGWPATPAPGAITNLGMIAHYDSGKWLTNRRRELQDSGKDPHRACYEYWNRTRDMHKSGNGWLDVGYAYFVCPDDRIFAGREYGHQQAAEMPTPGKLQGGNSRYIAVTFGLGPGEMPTVGALRAWHRLRAWYVAEKGSRAAVHGHRDFTATDCPGNEIYRLVRDGTLTNSPTEPDTKPEPPKPPAQNGDDMRGEPLYASFGSSETGTTELPPGEWVRISFDTESADPTDIHSGAGVSIVRGSPSLYALEFGGEIVGAPVGTIIDIDAAEYRYDGSVKPPADRLKEAGKTTSNILTDTLTVHHTAVGWVQKGRKLCVRARSHAPNPIKLTNARVSVAFWQ
jgi:hypothetical protein